MPSDFDLQFEIVIYQKVQKDLSHLVRRIQTYTETYTEISNSTKLRKEFLF